MKMETIYLIEKVWIDNLENRNPWGYDAIGFVETVEEAKAIVLEGGTCEDKECYAWGTIDFPAPKRYRYKEIKKYGS